jgi:transcriptional regulator with XRE-family HTH domain
MAARKLDTESLVWAAAHWGDRLVGRRVRAARKARDVSAEALAVAIGATVLEVKEHERGAMRIDAARLTRIADCLGLSASDLMAGIDYAGTPPPGEMVALVRAVMKLPAHLRLEVLRYAEQLASGKA